MAALVIESFPEDLHARLRQTAEAHQRSVSQETIHILERALTESDEPPPAPPERYWSRRPLLPEYEAMLAARAFNSLENRSGMIS